MTEDEYDMYLEEYRKMVANDRTWNQQAPLTAAAKDKKEGNYRLGSRERLAMSGQLQQQAIVYVKEASAKNDALIKKNAELTASLKVK